MYKGIEFVELKDLPPEQASLFKEFAPKEAFIKILIKEKSYYRSFYPNDISDADCIQYKDYRAWYQQHYDIRTVPAVVRLEQDLEQTLTKP